MSAAQERDEQLQRLNDIRKGPWNEFGATARKTFVLKSLKGLNPLAEIGVDILGPYLKQQTKERLEFLWKLGRFHLPGGVWKNEELEPRISLDEELTYYVLIELAVENGYLDEAIVREKVRMPLLKLIWSKGARRFIDSYSYLPVRMLAQRLGLNLWPRLKTLPGAETNSAFAFASFLSQVASFYKGEEIDAWQAFLDDYLPKSADLDTYDAHFIEFLEQKKKRARGWDSHYAGIAISAATYYQKLAYCLDKAEPAQRGSLGAFFHYWDTIAQGYLSPNYTYKKVHRNWGKAVIQSNFLSGLLPKSEYKVLLISHGIVEDTWSDTKQRVSAYLSEAMPEVSMEKAQ
jgi:hypothetical protein